MVSWEIHNYKIKVKIVGTAVYVCVYIYIYILTKFSTPHPTQSSCQDHHDSVDQVGPHRTCNLRSFTCTKVCDAWKSDKLTLPNMKHHGTRSPIIIWTMRGTQGLIKIYNNSDHWSSAVLGTQFQNRLCINTGSTWVMLLATTTTRTIFLIM